MWITFQHGIIHRFQPHLFSCLLTSQMKTILNKLEEHKYLEASCACRQLEFYEINPYITALVKDDKFKRKRCLSTNRISISKRCLSSIHSKLKTKFFEQSQPNWKSLVMIFSELEAGKQVALQHRVTTSLQPNRTSQDWSHVSISMTLSWTFGCLGEPLWVHNFNLTLCLLSTILYLG